MQKILYLFIILISSLLITSCSNVSNKELKFGKTIGLNEKDLIFIKKTTGLGIDEFVFKNSNTKGLKVFVEFDSTQKNRESLSKYFKPKGYLVFLSGQYYNRKGTKNFLTIIKSSDQFDIVKFQGTIDSNKKRPKTNEVIIEQLKKWENDFKFEIAGAEIYYIEAKFITKPSNMNKFADELTKFCPELLNDGTGKIEDLISDMNKNNSFYMLFD
jgi:hypothetical protein